MTREPVKSAVRVLEILKLFSIERRPLNQKEIISRLGYPQSSATFLLKSMVHTGYLSFERRDRTYLPAPEVYRLGEWLEDFGYEKLFRDGVIAQFLEQLRVESGETVSLTMQNDILVQWHRVLLSELPVGLYVSEGASFPLTWSPFGCMLLSQQPEHQIDRIIRLINVRETEPQRRINIPQMMAQLRGVRAAGYCVMRNTSLVGASAVATILPVQVAGRNVAVGIGGVAEHIEAKAESILRTLRGTIDSYRDQLEDAFGYQTTSHPQPPAPRYLEGAVA